MKLVNPKKAVEAGLIRELLDAEAQIQQIGVDMTLREAHAFSGIGTADFDNSQRKIPEAKKMEFDERGFLFLEKGAYKIIYNEVVCLPKNVFGKALTRTTLLRSGASISFGYWDPGYEGRSESLLVVENHKGIMLKRNARVAQISFYELHEEMGEYGGSYKKENL